MPFQIPETKAEEQNVYAFRPHLLALPQSQKVSSHGLLGKEGMEGMEGKERVKGWKPKPKQKRPTSQENDPKAFHLRINVKLVTMQIWVKVKSCYCTFVQRITTFNDLNLPFPFTKIGPIQPHEPGIYRVG
ncbi:hypothetical protein EAF00_000251 [Botryotinia globosa]|nr:hypothetical protein EAF00_000251 [Botryotinia globosa]